VEVNVVSSGSTSPPAARVQVTLLRVPGRCRTATEFDREWEIVLERAKQTKDLAPVHTYPEAAEQIAALPTEALDGYAEVLDALE
jgi:hypothetical protein